MCVVYESMADTATWVDIGTEEEYIKHEEKGKRKKYEKNMRKAKE
jgi:hypothetical protein